MAEVQALVSVDWLMDRLEDDALIVVDGSWHLPTEKRDGRTDYIQSHIPGAVFFDLDRHSSNTASLSHMLPDAETFGREMGQLGISNNHDIVVYDTLGMFSAARIWWMFRQFGARRVYVLDGGFPAWKQAGYPVDGGIPKRAETIFDAKEVHFRATVDGDMVHSALQSQDPPLILDARGPGRFFGREPEPRPGLRGGHIPGSVNLPYRSLLKDDMTFKSKSELKAIIEAAGLIEDKPAITTCGSGVTACILLVAMAEIGYPEIPLYDGSWAEWGAQQDLPVETE